ncbi:hypothetical protein VKT23_005344 [Stygiomarasmius scandens]|uniref:SMP domain-containing protein n=1 Tax=Marasmiellus scandens TaxID=2682957 RepID=A0ABR1JQJ6_9AGAR
MSSGRIFNVDEPKGAEQARFETTAASAQAEAPNSSISRTVEKNAEAVGFAAQDAADAAKTFGKESTGVAAKSAPLESGAETIESPYSPSGTNVGANASL